MSIKYSVNDYVSVFVENYLTKNRFNYSIGQIISIENNNYKIKLVNNQEIICNSLFFDYIWAFAPSVHKFEITNKDNMSDLIHYGKINPENIEEYLNKRMEEGKDNYEFSLIKQRLIKAGSIKPTKITYPVKHISKCVHGQDCERLGCHKGPKFCPHGEGCERMMCKAMY